MATLRETGPSLTAGLSMAELLSGITIETAVPQAATASSAASEAAAAAAAVRVSDATVLRLYSAAIVACFVGLMANAAVYYYRKKAHYFPAVCTIVSGEFREVSSLEVSLITAATVFTSAGCVKLWEIERLSNLQVSAALLTVPAVMYRMVSSDHRTGGVSYKFSTCIIAALVLGFYLNTWVTVLPLVPLLGYFVEEQARKVQAAKRAATRSLLSSSAGSSGSSSSASQSPLPSTPRKRAFVMRTLTQPVLLTAVFGSFVALNLRAAGALDAAAASAQ